MVVVPTVVARRRRRRRRMEVEQIADGPASERCALRRIRKQRCSYCGRKGVHDNIISKKPWQLLCAGCVRGMRGVVARGDIVKYVRTSILLR